MQNYPVNMIVEPEVKAFFDEATNEPFLSKDSS